MRQKSAKNINESPKKMPKVIIKMSEKLSINIEKMSVVSKK